DRTIRYREHAGFIGGRRRRKRGGIDDDIGRIRRKRSVQEGRRPLVLQARDEQAHRGKTAREQRRAQCIDRRGIAAREQRPVEEDSGVRPPVIDRLALPKAGRRHRSGARRRLAVTDQMCGEAQCQLGVIDAALSAIAPELVGILAAERAARRERGIPVHFPGHARKQRSAAQGVAPETFDAMRP
ncbi:hypothetical protein KXW36_000529, partial [Aspergillus fumigatus]